MTILNERYSQNDFDLLTFSNLDLGSMSL